MYRNALRRTQLCENCIQLVQHGFRWRRGNTSLTLFMNSGVREIILKSLDEHPVECRLERLRKRSTYVSGSSCRLMVIEYCSETVLFTGVAVASKRSTICDF